MSEKTKFVLSRAIKAHGQEVTELELREPTGDDVIEIGFPYYILMPEGQSSGIEIKPRAVYSYISRLAGIPQSSAKQIALSDFAQLQGVVVGFFGESVEVKSLD